MLTPGEARSPGPAREIRRAGVIGSPIDHSLSPALHRAAYRVLGLTGWDYGRQAVGGPGEPSVAAFLSGLDPQWVGVSATMPCKEALLAVADSVSPLAGQVGAANTLVRAERGWHADNTDVAGLSGALDELGAPRSSSATLVGAGATARAALAALAGRGVRTITAVVRGRVRPDTAALAEELGLRLIAVPTSGLREAVQDAEVTVLAVPGGTDLGLALPPPRSLTGRLVMDVGYANWPTPLARWAQAGGAQVVSGLPMLVHQAAEQVRLMTAAAQTATGAGVTSQEWAQRRSAVLAAMYAAVGREGGAGHPGSTGRATD
ncbi:MAG: shikimate dehydrogenase [Austwickia sp.]|nr:shikimate dehydrogenase [Austwickia sp.]MBK8435661.1 shikimate dehydrogenase [Austwickia sp.]